MKRVELESFTKSFLLFFISLGLLIGALFYFAYAQDRKVLDESILSQMRVCSFDLKCEQFSLDFAKVEHQELYTLLSDDKGVYSFFPISRSQQFVLKFIYAKDAYNEDLFRIQRQKTEEFVLVLFVIMLLSVLFSFYALHPLRSALKLTEEFVKDILHDFNTPLSALRLNISMLKRDVGQNSKISRIEQGIETILVLQQNLRGYLDQHAARKEPFELSDVIHERATYLQNLFPDIAFIFTLDKLEVDTNKDALTRVIDNLLSNAAKYNKKEGHVEVMLNAKRKCLIIKDTGKGIKEPTKVFKRFYTEQERGVGIGLHIVKKLCDEMKIPLSLESEVGVGSTFQLDLSALTLR